jgi:hypothetical protein
MARRDLVRTVLISALVLLAGCAGCPSFHYSPRLTPATAVDAANSALRASGYDLSNVKPSDVDVRYDRDHCVWAVIYTLYTDRLPVGPLVIVHDRTGRAQLGGDM